MKSAMDYAAVDGIEKISEWLDKRGFALEFAKRAGAYFDVSKKIVTVSSHQQVQKQLHLLLHECGHIIISGSGINKYPNGYRKIDEARDGRDELHKMDVIAEEFDAWHKGKCLASRLGVVFDHDEYDRTRATCIKTYMKWALRKGRVKD